MNMLQLKEYLISQDIPADLFGIRTAPVSDGIYINTSDTFSEVFVFIDGNKQKVQTFQYERDAIMYFYAMLVLFVKHNPFNKLTLIIEDENIFININKLKEILSNNPSISPSSYCFYEEQPYFEAMCLKVIGTKWKVYYAERGNENGLIIFDKEVDACIYMYGNLLANFNRYQIFTW